MVEITCLWCESPLRVEPAQLEAEVTCPECLSTWVFEDQPEPELALAA